MLSGTTSPLTVVGVAGETRNGALDARVMPVVYVPVYPGAGTVVLLGCDSNPELLVPQSAGHAWRQIRSSRRPMCV